MKIIWKIEFKVSFLQGKWDKAIFQYIWKMHPSLLPLKSRSNKASLKRQTFVVFLVFVCDIRGAADFSPCWCWNLINVNRWGLEYSQSIKQTRHYFPCVNEASKICYQNCESCLEYGFSHGTRSAFQSCSSEKHIYDWCKNCPRGWTYIATTKRTSQKGSQNNCFQM